jgi:hypothetical protein
MWSEVEREVNKQPHNTLASHRAKISEVMAYKDKGRHPRLQEVTASGSRLFGGWWGFNQINVYVICR